VAEDPPPPPSDTGLLAYWKFDDNGNDESGNANTAVLKNAASYASGKFGSALDIQGRNDAYANVMSSESLKNITNKLTVTAWAYAYTAPDAYNTLVSRQRENNGHPDQFFLGFGLKNNDPANVTYKWHLSTTVGIYGGDCYQNKPVVEEWVHMAGTYDGAKLRLYVNGKKICESTLTGNIPVDLDTNPITIGLEENGAAKNKDEEFDGKIDEVRIYNRALSDAEILALANQ
jgi:hypothetical protein